ncbi:MAG: glycosyltransferase family 9 protein [Candidatus Krumholzibacteria bacterium]|nr:glycosyltransferase family 9 protein [Candidatus Krumholzibacteria bacterium]
MEAIGTNGCRPDLCAYEARSIVIMRLKALGDIALSLPIVYALRSRYPHAHIRYLCRERYAGCLAGVRELDEILILPPSAMRQALLMLKLKREGVDCVIDLLGSPRSGFLTFLTGAEMRIGMDTGRRNWCYTHLLPRVIMRGGERIKCYTLESNRELIRLLGLEPDLTAGLEIGFPAAERQKGWAREYLEGLHSGRKRIIGIVPGSTYHEKSWPEGHFMELARLACERLDAVCVILWGPGEEGLAGRIARGAPGSVLAPPTDIGRLGALVSMLDLVVGIDSGPKHLAVIQGVPTVTVFGPTDPRIWDPMTRRHRSIRVAAYSAGRGGSDSAGKGDLSSISPEAVLKEMTEVLEDEAGARGGSKKGGCA